MSAFKDCGGLYCLHVFDREDDHDPRGLFSLDEFDELVNALIELRWRWFNEEDD